MTYKEVKIVWKSFVNYYESTQWKYLTLKIKKEVINKRAAGIIRKCKNFYICKGIFENKYLKDKKYRKVRDHCLYTGDYRGAAHSICNLKYSLPKKSPIVFHNGSNYDYHFIMKELAEELIKQFNCWGENTEKYIKKEKEITRINKNGEEVTKNISYILKFIDSRRFIASLLSNLVNNLSDGIHRIKCKFGHNDTKCKTCGIKYKYCGCFLEYINFKDDIIENKCLCCNKKY